MFLDGAGHFFDRSQPTADGPGIPLLPSLLGPGPTGVVPELHAQRLDGPGPCRFQGAGSQDLKRTLSFP